MTTKVITWGFLLLCVYTISSFADQALQQSRGHLLKTLLNEHHYDKTLRPYSTATDYVLVKANMYIRGITNVDPKNHVYNLQLILRQEWNDPRLTFDDQEGKIKYLTLTTADKIWVPDFFFANSLKEHFFNVPVPNSYIRIFPNGDVLYSMRVAVDLAQDRDTLKLPIRVASYGYTTDDIVYQWKEENPIQMAKSLKNYDLAETIHSNSTTTTGSYSSLTAELGSSLTNERLNREGAKELEKQDEILRTILDPDNYNKKVKPVGTNGSQILVQANGYILNIKELDAEKQEVSIIAYVRQKWNDDRLKYDDQEGQIPHLTLTDPQDIWKPDMFFSNSLKDKLYEVTVPNHFAKITPDGSVLYSQRVAVKFPCTVVDDDSSDLRCSLQMESYGYSKNDMQYTWDKKEPNAFGYNPKIIRNKYQLANVTTDYSDVKFGKNEYCTLHVILNLHKV